MLGERKALEDAGRWAAEKDFSGRLEPKSDETHAWMEAANADFSRCRFVLAGDQGDKTPLREVGEEDEHVVKAVKSIPIGGGNGYRTKDVFSEEYAREI